MDLRRDDWRHGVDENLASLNAGQRVWERDLETIHKLLDEFDAVLRGDPEEGTSGLIGRLEVLENHLARLNAVVFVDSTGKKGLLHDVEALKTGELTLGERWKFATALTAALLSLAGLLITNWDRVEQFFGRKEKLSPLEQIIQKAKHPARRHYVIRELPPEKIDEEPE